MPLDAQAESLRQLFAGSPPLSELTVEEARQVASGFAALQRDPQPVEETRELRVPGPAGDLPVRVHLPRGAADRRLIVYFHGGGFVIGSVDLLDPACRALANATSSAVASVEYRLAPEAKFPAAVEDAFAAATWLHDHPEVTGAGPGPIVVAGDSAGGALAAVTAVLSRDRGGPAISAQVLYCPVTAAPSHGFASYQECGRDYMLTADDMRWFWDHYTSGPADDRDPLAAPLVAPDLSGVAPAVIVVAGYDPLRDEGLAYADRLRDALVPVEVLRYDGQMHDPLWAMGALDAAGQSITAIAAALHKIERGGAR
jgi:acetyl esterase